MPPNMSAQPRICTPLMTSPRMIQLDTAPKTASKLMSRDAVAGRVYFCPTICSVNATPADMTPP